MLQVSGARGRERLVPEDPVDAARCRIWADKVNRECCSPYYSVLVRKDPKEQQLAFEALITGLRSFSSELEKSEGPLFLPDAQVETCHNEASFLEIYSMRGYQPALRPFC